MHAVDLYKWVANNPRSNIGLLYLHGVDYPNAMTPTPSGGFPGMLALTTGGSPKTTGVYDEDSYDRTLFPPGSGCIGSPGTEVIYDHTLAQDASQLFSPIHAGNLPQRLNSQGQCVPVYPHEFVKAPTLFEVVQTSGRRTLWTDNHASYEILAGPSGKGLSEFYAPEIRSFVANGGIHNGVNLTASLSACNATNSAGGLASMDYASCLPAAQAYDDVKVQAVVNKIEGFSADGSRLSAVPTVLGMNFSAVGVAQRLPMGGYINAGGDPGPLLIQALEHVDFSIGRILAELETERLIQQTLVVLTAKHGQAPIDVTRRRTEADLVNPVTDPLLFVQMADPTVGTPGPFTNPNDGRAPVVNGHVQTRDGALVWLQDQNNVNVSNVVQLLSDPLFREAMGATVRPQGSIFSSNIASGAELIETYGNPQSSDPIASARAPNVFIQPDLGVLYTTANEDPNNKRADHGGGAQDDINVPLLISNPGIVQHVSIFEPVSTRQVAPTILKALRLNGSQLTAAMSEQTATLPGIVWGPGDYQAGSTFPAVDYDSQTNTQVDGTPPYVSYFDAGDSICFNNVFLTDVTAIRATLASANSGGVFSVRIGGPTGAQIGSFTVQATGGWTTWATATIPITATTGLQTLCFRGESGTGIANLQSFELIAACIPECTGATCGSNGCGGTCGTCGFNFLCDDPFGQCVTPPTKYSVVDTSLPSTIPAPAFDVQSGTQLGSGGTSVVSFDANNYLCYYGVDLTNVQKLVTSLASTSTGGVLSLRIDSPTGPQIGSYTVSSTGGAASWRSKQIPITVPTVGTHALCIRGESGSGIASFQSFQLSADPVAPKWIVGSTIPANPPDTQQGTTNNSGAGGYVTSFDANDYVCYEEVDLAGVNSIVARVASSAGGGVFSARLGSPSGTRVATFGVPATGGATSWSDITAGIAPTSGMTTLCFVGDSGNGVANLQSFTLSSVVIPADYTVGSVIPASPPDIQQGTTLNPGGYIGFFDSGDYVCYQNVDLAGVNSIVANIASNNNGGVVTVRVGSQTGTQIGAFTVLSTGGWTTWANVNVPITATSGITTLCFVGASGSGIANLRTFTLSASTVSWNYALGGTIPATPVSSQQGVMTTGGIISYFDSNDWFCYAGINLSGVRTVRARAGSGNGNGRFSVRIGSQNGYQVGTFNAFNTGGFSAWGNYNIAIANVPGVHTLCIYGTASTGIANFQNFTLSP